MAVIHATVIDGKNGLKEVNNVVAIRIQSKKYRLLVMDDYAPMIGRVDGNVIIIDRNREYRYEDIYAYYRINHNEFSLIIDRYRKSESDEKN